MMRPWLWATALAIGFLPHQARACMDSSFETYVLFDTPPMKVPAGIMVVRVLVRHAGEGQMAAAEILAPVDGLRDVRHIAVDPGRWSDCSRWGRVGTPAYMIGMVKRTATGIVFEAAQLPRQSPKLPHPEAPDSFIVDPDYHRAASRYPRSPAMMPAP